MDKDDNKITRITLKVTVGQREAILKMAGFAGQSLSNYVRAKLGLPPEQKGERKDLRRPKAK